MSHSFSIWIDADSCPAPARDIIIRCAKRNGITTWFIANREIPHPKDPLFSMVICNQEKDAADNYIVENAAANDLVITRDILLAERLLAKGCTAINDRGNLFSADTIRERLSLRNFNLELFQNGLIGDKMNTYGKKETALFANCFDREIQKKLKAEQTATK
ncbi:MAG: DUF188 domain-containing protein [Treponemataceae bacterium]|nr:DUF188 domain-containing protein [Treponemataceae bacterium]